MGFIERFSELTSERGAVARLAEAIPVSDSLLSKYKRGLAEPSLGNAILIADFFDVSLDWLAGRPGYARDAHRAASSPPLPPDESALVDSYRRMDAGDRPAFLSTARALAYAGEAKKAGTGDAERVARGDVREEPR